jgi:hypothetical protein
MEVILPAARERNRELNSRPPKTQARVELGVGRRGVLNRKSDRLRRYVFSSRAHARSVHSIDLRPTVEGPWAECSLVCPSHFITNRSSRVRVCAFPPSSLRLR